MSILYLEEAKRHVEAFGADFVVKDHHQAMDGLDCEAFLQVGIDAYEWVTKADRVIRKAVFEGLVEYDFEVDEAIENLLRRWILPCPRAHRWIDRVQKNGHKLGNLDQFLECERQVQAMVRFLDEDKMRDSIRELRDHAIAEQNSGKTAEFV